MCAVLYSRRVSVASSFKNFRMVTIPWLISVASDYFDHYKLPVRTNVLNGNQHLSGLEWKWKVCGYFTGLFFSGQFNILLPIINSWCQYSALKNGSDHRVIASYSGLHEEWVILYQINKKILTLLDFHEIWHRHGLY